MDVNNAKASKLSSSATYLPSLDGMRALSILLVLGAHILTNAIPGGYGVFLFFIISGFLITRLSLASATEYTGASFYILSFYAKRFFRLYPVVVVYCLVICSIYFFKEGDIDSVEPLSALFYFANYLVSIRSIQNEAFQMPFKVFWSLSLEEHFYIAFPIILILLRFEPLRILRVAAVIAAFSIVSRFLFVMFIPELAESHVVYMQTPFRLDAICYGVMLACLCDLAWGRKLLARLSTNLAWILAFVSICLSVAILDPWQEVFRDPLMAFGMCVAIVSLSFNENPRFAHTILNLRPLRWIGTISYSLYVWHIPVGITVKQFSDTSFGVISAILLSIVVAALSYYVIEAPFIRMGRRLLSKMHCKRKDLKSYIPNVQSLSLNESKDEFCAERMIQN